MNPVVIILLSGKRKSGKDFISEQLLNSIGNDNCTIVRISEPIKSYFAKEKNLSLGELMSDDVYKEKYRLDMIKWSEEVRNREPGYFCKAACEKAQLRPIWIVSDIRRKTDIKWFRDIYNDRIKTIRISANENIRAHRGFVFTNGAILHTVTSFDHSIISIVGVDDATSECDLDDYIKWDLCVTNNNQEEGSLAIQEILHLIKR